MKITVLTLFPESLTSFLNNSIIKRVIQQKILTVELVNIRDFSIDKYNRADSAPVGGGPGLILKAQPIISALNKVKSEHAITAVLDAKGRLFKQADALRFANEKHLILICGHYEGIDDRVNQYANEVLSVGDFILTGGEVGAMMIIDAIMRLLPGAIDRESIIEESHNDGLLEYPQYTEPYDFEGQLVPDILYSGNHVAIKRWRRLQQLLLTRKRRPDLFSAYKLSKTDQIDLANHDQNIDHPWLIDALKKGHKFIK